MERAEIHAVALEPQRTFLDAADRFDGVDHLEDRELFRNLGEGHAAADAALRIDDACASQILQDLGKIGLGDERGRRDLVGGAGFGRFAGEKDHRAEGVFDRLREHGVPDLLKLDIDIQNRLATLLQIGVAYPIFGQQLRGVKFTPPARLENPHL